MRVTLLYLPHTKPVTGINFWCNPFLHDLKTTTKWAGVWVPMLPDLPPHKPGQNCSQKLKDAKVYPHDGNPGGGSALPSTPPPSTIGVGRRRS
jgi:hypothetical protein